MAGVILRLLMRGPTGTMFGILWNVLSVGDLGDFLFVVTGYARILAYPGLKSTPVVDLSSGQRTL